METIRGKLQFALLGLVTLIASSGTGVAQVAQFHVGDRVEALPGGVNWLQCEVIQLIPYGRGSLDYQVKCDTQTFNGIQSYRVAADNEHIRRSSSSSAPVAASLPPAAAQELARRKAADNIDSNLRTPTLARGGQPLSGLYLQLRPMMGDASSGRVEWDYFYFWPDGHICEVAPKGGLDHVDFDALRQQYPRLCGRYQFTPAQLAIDVPDNPRVFNYAVHNFDGTSFVMDRYATVKVRPISAATNLDGVWKGAQLNGQYLTIVYGFHAGSFLLAEFPRGQEAAPTRKFSGTYKVAGNTLDLGSERHTIFPVDTDGKTRLEIDGTEFEKIP